MPNIINIPEEDNINYITNNLLLRYDEKFNTYYDKINYLNSSVMNKEEILAKVNQEIILKNITISSLKYSILLVLLLGGLFIAYGIKKIQLNTFIGASIILIILFVIITYYSVKIHLSITNFEKNLRNLKVEMSKYVDEKLADQYMYTCPSDCTDEENIKVNINQINTYQQPTLRTDSQVNVWKYGDIPNSTYTSSEINPNNFYNTKDNIPLYRKTLEEISENDPQPAFGSSSFSKTYYQCQWNGATNNLSGKMNNQGLPNIEKNNIYSTIPCSYRPNFSEKGKYICKSDPNNLNTEQFKESCDTI